MTMTLLTSRINNSPIRVVQSRPFTRALNNGEHFPKTGLLTGDFMFFLGLSDLQNSHLTLTYVRPRSIAKLAHQSWVSQTNKSEFGNYQGSICPRLQSRSSLTIS